MGSCLLTRSGSTALARMIHGSSSRNRAVAKRDRRAEPRGREASLKQYVDRPSGEPACLDAVPTAPRLVAAATPRLEQKCSRIMRAVPPICSPAQLVPFRAALERNFEQCSSSLTRPHLLGKCGSRAPASFATQIPPALMKCWKTASGFSLPHELPRPMWMCSSQGTKTYWKWHMKSVV